MSFDSDSFREMFELSGLPDADQSDVADEPTIEDFEPPIRNEVIEPPIRSLEPPPSKMELEAAAADELLKIAAQEEQDIKKVRQSLAAKDTFLMRCPNGCTIRVKEQHRGRAAKCPRCKCDLVVPKKKPTPSQADGSSGKSP